MGQRDRLDAESREPLERFLERFPGGFNAIPDIVERRSAAKEFGAERAAELPPNDRVRSRDEIVPGPDGAPDVAVRVYTPVAPAATPRPGVFFVHGGGMIFGDIDGEDAIAAMLCELLEAVVVSTDYRKAPEHPHPAQSEDCYASLAWTARNADELGVDASRLALFGRSAGGNLVAACALLARDRGFPDLRYVMSIYPMLDPRNETASAHEVTEVGAWDRDGNAEAWSWFLAGREPDGYAAPLLADDLRGLPPTFVDVGTMDLFRDEDLEFVRRLAAAGVPTEFHLYPGAYHASETFAPEAPLSQRIWATRIDALRRALAG